MQKMKDITIFGTKHKGCFHHITKIKIHSIKLKHFNNGNLVRRSENGNIRIEGTAFEAKSEKGTNI